MSDEDSLIRDDFLDDHLYILYSIYDSLSTPWFANIVNYLVAFVFPSLASKAQKDKIKSDAKHFIWDQPYLWKLLNEMLCSAQAEGAKGRRWFCERSEGHCKSNN